MSCLPRCACLVLTALPLLHAFPARAAEVMCDTSFEDCRTPLLNFIRRETDSIDVAMWFMEDLEMADAIVARFQAGVQVRALVDPRRNAITPINATVLAKFRDAGIPMRYKVGGGILHWKFMIFNAQNTVQWSAANYSDFYFKPAVPYRDYTDEGIYFCDDPAVLNSFRRKFDDSWIDTAGFSNYANISGTPTRTYPLYAIDPDMNFVPAQDFAARSKPLYDAESERIDVIMYKITEGTHADGLIRARGRGIPVRLIVEPERYRNAENVWQAYHVDRLYMAGVQIRERAHAGFLHQKSTLLYSQGLTIFGSSNWSTESNRSQYEHNYFTDKAWFFTWFKNNFERKWGNTTGNVETKAFVPLPPDEPVYVAPANGTTGASTSAVTLSWRPGPWAHRADIYFGTSPTPPLVAANVSVSPGSTKTYTTSALTQGTTYYWRIVSKTIANQTASGPTFSFTTAGVTATLPAPTTISPGTSIVNTTPTYTWNAVATATWYELRASDSGGPALQQWYSAAQLGCPSGTGRCASTPYVPLASGAARWDVRAWNSGSGNGSWSVIRNFTIVAPSSPPSTPMLVSPSGSVASERPLFVWNTAPTSSWYQLWIRDGRGVVAVDRWFTLSEVGCSSGEATCSMVSPAMLAAGAGVWYIRTWNDAGFGQWSAGKTFSITPSVPGRPTLRTPAGTIPTTRPIYTWIAVPDATWYLLWVRDANGGVIETWHTSAEAHCESGTGVCTLASPPLATGAAVWYVRGWNPTGYGPWSAPSAFSVTVPSSPPSAVDTLLWPYGPSFKQPMFSWKPAATATWYRVRVLNDSDAIALDQWFDAAAVGCSSGEPTCSITAAVTLTAGSFRWDVQTWNAAGYGSLSPLQAFSVRVP